MSPPGARRRDRAPDPELEASTACPRCGGREHHPGTEPVCAACGVPMVRAFYRRGERISEAEFRRALLPARSG